MKQKLANAFLYYLRTLARLQLLKKPYKTIIGVTGSAGKTSTVLALKATLKPNLSVKTSLKGGNSETGLPLSILDLSAINYSILDWLRICLLAPLKLLTNWRKFDVFVAEMGIDSPHPPKNMDYLLSIIKPDIGIFLNVSPVHQQFFNSLDQIAREKAKLVNSVPTAIINLSDPLVRKYTKNKHIIPISNVRVGFPDPLPEIYQISLNAALTTAQLLKIPQKKALANLKANFTLPPSRATILKGINNSIIIDSSYNASPLANLEMLKFLSTFKSPKIAILGDMRELGDASPTAHKSLYKQALKYADQIISIGPETSKYFGPKAIKFLYYWQVTDYLACHPATAGPTILIKGSQNTIYTEEVVKALLKNKRNIKKVCRQSKYWTNLKAEFKQKHS